jgi:hypothetical protein
MATERPKHDEASEDSPSSRLTVLLNVRWAPAIFLVYVLSIMPAYVVVLWLRSRGIDLYAPFEVFYWPVIWLIRNVDWARRLDSWIEPVLRRLAP